MGFVDKLKNIFFEEEEEEEEIEDTRPLKKMREREKIKAKDIDKAFDEEIEKPKEIIAKKVELPKRRREVVEEPTKVEEINFEGPSRTSKEPPKEYVEIPRETPKEPKKEQPKINSMIFDDEDFLLSDIKPKEETKPEKNYRVNKNYPEKEVRERETPTYEYKRQEEKPKGFTPSPIISPIYGILDKNYKKEEVKENKEIRITSRVSKVDLDSVRNKAFGDLENDLFPGSLDDDDVKPEIPSQDIKKIKEDMEDDGKPVVDKVTLGEADEYYSDLGLAYNTDYKDISKEINDGKVKTKRKDEGEKLEDNLFDLIEDRYDKED